ncbi:MAG: GvpL/GvpF family gas vesicle protein [Gemmatimonadaceae bacterium]
MTPVHLYGVLGAEGRDPPSIAGLDGHPVRALPLGERFAWVSELNEPAQTVTPRRLREHDAVLGRAVAAGLSPAPALVGRSHASDDAVIAALGARDAAIGEALALARGRVEMSLLIAPAAAPTPSQPETAGRGGEGAGARHLRRIASELHGERNLLDAASVLAQSLAVALAGMVVAERIVENAAPPVLIGRAHLIARGDVERYLESVEQLIEASDPFLRVVVRGPGAAYSFAAVQGG